MIRTELENFMKNTPEEWEICIMWDDGKYCQDITINPSKFKQD